MPWFPSACITLMPCFSHFIFAEENWPLLDGVLTQAEVVHEGGSRIKGTIQLEFSRDEDKERSITSMPGQFGILLVMYIDGDQSVEEIPFHVDKREILNKGYRLNFETSPTNPNGLQDIIQTDSESLHKIKFKIAVLLDETVRVQALNVKQGKLPARLSYCLYFWSFRY